MEENYIVKIGGLLISVNITHPILEMIKKSGQKLLPIER